MHQHGFTLIDLCTAFMILALLAGIAFPNLHFFYAKNHNDAVAHDILRSLQIARFTAVTAGQNILICATDEHNQCTNRNIQKFTLFVDENDNGVLDMNEHIHSILEVNSAANAIHLNDPSRTTIRFNAQGFAHPPASFIVCPATHNPRLIRRISVNRTGRSYVAKPRPNGIVAFFDRKPIECDRF